MTDSQRREIEEEIALAELMINDLNRLWKSYAKKAFIAKQEREKRQDKKGFLDYQNEEELEDAYGYADIDEETYNRGRDYFKSLKKPPDLSVVEKHRNRIKELLNIEKGTLKELMEELNPAEKKETVNGFVAYDNAQREKRQKEMELSEALDRVFIKK